MTDWPEDLTPQRSSVYVRNELVMEAPCDAVWDVLAEAAEWPAWYSHCKNVRIEGGGARLEPGARFRWSTNGQPLRSRFSPSPPASGSRGTPSTRSSASITRGGSRPRRRAVASSPRRRSAAFCRGRRVRSRGA